MTTRRMLTLLTITVLASASSAQMQKTQAMLMALGANSKQMLPYQWKQRTVVLRNGNPTGSKLDEVRFDAAGQPQRITLSQPEPKRMGPLMARKAAAVKSDVQDVMQLAGRYAHPQTLADAIRRGELWEGQGSLKVRARSVVLPGDEMVMLVNTVTLLPARIDFQTQYEGSPVRIAIDYQQLVQGPDMVSRMTVQIPKDGIVVNVDSFDFVRLFSSLVP